MLKVIYWVKSKVLWALFTVQVLETSVDFKVLGVLVEFKVLGALVEFKVFGEFVSGLGLKYFESCLWKHLVGRSIVKLVKKCQVRSKGQKISKGNFDVFNFLKGQLC